jgi:hypothetical protein
VVKGLCFASGLIFGVLLACAACSQTQRPPQAPTGYYGPPPAPPPGSHPEISKAMSELQHARYVLQVEATNDYHGHKANAVGFIDNAIGELQVCKSMP